MAHHRTHEHTTEGHGQRTQEKASEAHAPAGHNGAGEATPPASDDRMQRAEQMVDRVGEQVGHLVSVLGHQVLRLAARAREEAEDIWAEAQNIRRGRTP